MNTNQAALYSLVEELPLDERRKLLLLKIIATDGQAANLRKVVSFLREYASDLGKLADLMEQDDMETLDRVAEAVAALEQEVENASQTTTLH